jgi:phospholipid-translocating ATPase
MWKEIKVGSVVKIFKNEFFPADLVLLNSSAPKGICYIETKNLDGETNLKHKQSNKEVMSHCSIDEAVATFKSEVLCEMPNDKIY